MGRTRKWNRSFLGGSLLLFAGIAGGGSTPVQPPPSPPVAARPAEENKLQGLVDQLGKVGAGLAGANNGTEISAINLQQAQIITQILAEVTAEEQIPWIRQLASCLNAAAINSSSQDTRAYHWLVRVEDQLVRTKPGTPLTAAVTFLEMQAGYAMQLAQSQPDLKKIQMAWRERLAKFIQAYPKAEDAPNALLELGMTSEFLNEEAEAKKWYQTLVRDFPNQPQARKAQGALHRLELEGTVLGLTLPLLYNQSDSFEESFNIDQLRGKLVVLYFWVSDPHCLKDFQELRQIRERFTARGLEVVFVNLDKSKKEARDFLNGQQPPGIHLFQKDGVGGKLTVQYGLTALPAILLVDRDGKVVSRKGGFGTLEREIGNRLK